MKNLNLSAQRLRDGLLFCGRIEWELGGNWIVQNYETPHLKKE